MTATRQIEIFSAGCQVCEDTIALVNRMACPSCQVTVLDMKDKTVACRAKELGIHTIPAVVVDGEVASCCADKGPTEEGLRQEGVGQALS
ncbi:MAG: thioredoxin family protein [Nitrospira sp.]|nr:thioredoxin family protein [Nitrospira sp.]